LDRELWRVVACEEGRVQFEADDLAAHAELDDTPVVSRLTLKSENNQKEMCFPHFPKDFFANIFL